MKIRDRIKEFRRVPAGQLRPNPKNWRSHPPCQQDALRGILAEVGIADALLVRELDDGSYQLIDGHLRADTLGSQNILVLVLDVSEEEAEKVLLTHDSITGLAEMNEELFRELRSDLDFQSPALTEMLAEMLAEEKDAEKSTDVNHGPDKEIPELYQIKIICSDEQQQEELYNRLTAEGLQCELMNL